MIAAGSHEQLNHRLGAADYLRGEADWNFYARLCDDIGRMARDGDNVNLPNVRELHAWRRAYAIYEKLRDREEASARLAAANIVRAPAPATANWQQYVQDRSALLGYLTPDAIERLGLTADDLAKLDANGPWLRRAHNIARALDELKSSVNLSPQEQTIARLQAAVERLTSRVEKLEQPHGK
jgi:hypothetical protein